MGDKILCDEPAPATASGTIKEVANVLNSAAQSPISSGPVERTPFLCRISQRMDNGSRDDNRDIVGLGVALEAQHEAL